MKGYLDAEVDEPPLNPPARLDDVDVPTVLDTLEFRRAAALLAPFSTSEELKDFLEVEITPQWYIMCRITGKRIGVLRPTQGHALQATRKTQ